MQSIIYEQFGGEAKVNVDVDVLLNNYFLSLRDLLDYNVRCFSLSTNFYLDRFTCFLLFVPPSFSFVQFECV